MNLMVSRTLVKFMADFLPANLKEVKVLQNLYRRIREIEFYMILLIRISHKLNKKFIIFGQGRSGSTLLVDLLNSHPAIYCDDEILMYKVIFPKTYVKARSVSSKKHVYGFKVKIYQLWHQNILDSHKFLFHFYKSGWKILYLKRGNYDMPFLILLLNKEEHGIVRLRTLNKN